MKADLVSSTHSNKRKALVTGATGGIGKAIAEHLAQDGVDLVLVGRNTEKLMALQSSLQQKNATVSIEIMTCDLVQPSERQLLVEHVKRSAQSVNVLVNCAGISQFALLDDSSEQAMQKMFEVNVISVMALCKDLNSYFKQLSKQQKVQIVNVGSTFGSIAYPGFSIYSASKFALRGFTEAYARELSDTNIEVKYLSPRATKTDINSDRVFALNQELGVQMDEPEQVALAFMSLLKSKKSRLFIGFPEKLFVLINSVFPKLVSSSIAKQLKQIKSHAQQRA